MTHATLFIIMDAGRDDYVQPETMPFLHGLAQQGLRGGWASPPGFAQRTVLFTGLYPDTSGNFSAFVFDPEHSPFRWLRKLGPLPKLVRPRKFMVPARWAIQWISERSGQSYHADPAWIPTVYQPFFRPCEDMRPVHDPGALGATSIFDLCRAQGLSYSYRAHPVSGNDDAIFRGLARDLRAGAPHELFVAQFSATDQLGHVHGPFSDRMQQQVLPDLDRKVASLHAALAAGYDSWDIVVCGDHGMAPVTKRVDVQKRIRQLPLKPGRDYVMLVNSTLAVFWYLTERGEREIEAELTRIEGAWPVSAEERKKRRIPTERRWGDRMLAAEPGVLFWPDHFHVTDSTIVAMHGYLDKRGEDWGMSVMASSTGRIPRGQHGPRSLVDVFPTLCDLTGLKAPTTEGRSVLEPHAVVRA
jgi:predicted AlkP superfamily pyrophosphatase or phosphodiesterase